jgi:hypothetical protein
MKICYFDESGTGQEPVAVVTGVIVDTQRMHVTKAHWGKLLQSLSRLCGRELKELHTKDFYAGSGPFRAMQGADRARYITETISWFCDRKHNFVYSAIHKGKFESSKKGGRLYPELQTAWRAGAFHCILAIQRAHQALPGTKGHTLLIFDNKGHDEGPLTQMVLSPPEWSDSYYSRRKKQPQLEHIVDAPYFADSKHVPMLQVADFLAYFIRRYVEIADGLVREKYEDEEARIREWVSTLSEDALASIISTRARGAV